MLTITIIIQDINFPIQQSFKLTEKNLIIVKTSLTTDFLKNLKKLENGGVPRNIDL